MSLSEYVTQQREVFNVISQTPHYTSLIDTVDRLYHCTIAIAPAHSPRIVYGKLLLMSHRSLLSAATLIAQGQPDDAAPVTRRAIEMGHLAVAVHLDKQNYVRWLDEQRRQARWDERQRGLRPAASPGHKWDKTVLEHPMLTDLRNYLGIISDSTAHFTPEFEGQLPWTDLGQLGVDRQVRLEYMQTDKRRIKCAFVGLAGVHLRLLDIVDLCCNRRLQDDGGWRLLRTTAWAIGQDLGREFAPTEPSVNSATMSDA